MKLKKYQSGGPAPTPAPAPAPAPAADPIMEIANMMVQALQNGDCNLAMQSCEAFLALIQQTQGGAPAPAPAGEPVFKKGGKLVRRK